MRSKLVLLLWLGAACDGSRQATRMQQRDTVSLQRIVGIGEITGPDEYQFGYVAGVTGDPQGRVYVSDRMGSFVRVYGGGGEFLRQIGRKGAGPGEFSEPSDLFFDTAGHLWVRDRMRATVLASRSPEAVPDSVVEIRPFQGYTNYLSSARSRLIDGIYYYPDDAGLYREDEPDRYFYFGYDRAGPTADTIPVPPYETIEGSGRAFYRTSSSGGRLLYGINRAPFEPGPSWELTRRGTIIGGSGGPRVVETDRRGDTLRVIELLARRPVSRAERADSAAALQARLDSVPVPLDRVQGVSERVRSGSLPDSVPGSLAVHTSQDGEIWVRRWPPEGEGDRTYFDVYTREGDFRRTVVVPELLVSDPPPFIGGGRMIAVTRDPATDVHRVVVYRLDADR